MADKRTPLRRTAAPEGPTKHYFVVNPSGAIHDVSREHAQWRLSQGMGWRMATASEIELYRATPQQRAGRPLAQPWEPLADMLPAVDEPGDEG